MGPASNSWPHTETDAQRRAILAAADRLLTGTAQHATGRLSVVQLAVEAQVKYWVVAQKHTDLRDHFQHLAADANKNAETTTPPHPGEKLRQERDELREHCTKLEQLVTLYATALNEVALENHALREQTATRGGTVTPLRPQH